VTLGHPDIVNTLAEVNAETEGLGIPEYDNSPVFVISWL
jgi:hypothetical protein